jgi:hypothetical protein
MQIVISGGHTDIAAVPKNFSVAAPVHGIAMLRVKKIR